MRQWAIVTGDAVAPGKELVAGMLKTTAPFAPEGTMTETARLPLLGTLVATGLAAPPSCCSSMTAVGSDEGPISQ